MFGRRRNVTVLLLCGALLGLTIFFSGDNYDDSAIRQLEKENQILHRMLRKSKMQRPNMQSMELYDEPCLQSSNGSRDCLQAHSNKQNCEVIHVAIVCAGHNSTRTVVTVLKSILFYRTKPLYLHIISDSVAMVILEKLLRTWRLYEINWSFYPTYTIQHYVDWVPNRHYSGQYGLMKLALTDILPKNVEKTIVLDTDIIFACDIAELWRLFDSLGKKAIGIVENQSDWYIRGKIWKKHRPWPALGAGFNTGVMLMNLKMLREMKWMDIWKKVTEKELKSLKATVLADQDIMNAVLKENPDLMKILPCHWNLQLSEHTKCDECYSKSKELKIVHWNSPWKLKLKNKHAEYFINLYLTFLNFDGNLLRRQLFACTNTSATDLIESEKKNDECSDFRQEKNAYFRIHLYYLDYVYTPVKSDVTLVTQLSMDRLQMIGPLSMHWKGPMSIALYLSDSDTQQFLRYVWEHETLTRRKNIGYHIVFKDSERMYYPVNYLRNVAIEQVKTEFVYMSDIDFLPMFGLYDYLKQSVQMEHLITKKKVLLVPAFESLRYILDFPRSKTELVKMLNSGELHTFRYHVWPQGHAPTDFKRWRNATHPYVVKWDADFEPYLVFHKNLGGYDERFIGFGWNKVSHIMQLDVDGYEFIVLPNAFMIHMPHAPSEDLSKFRSSPLYRRCLKIMKDEFLQELERDYGNKALKYIEAEKGKKKTKTNKRLTKTPNKH